MLILLSLNPLLSHCVIGGTGVGIDWPQTSYHWRSAPKTLLPGRRFNNILLQPLLLFPEQVQ